MNQAKNFGEVRELLTIRQVAEQTGLCYRSVHRAIRAGRIKAVRLGGVIRVPRKEFDRIATRGF